MIKIIEAYIAGKTIEYRELDRSKLQKWDIKSPYKGDISFYPNDFEYRIQPETTVKYVLAAHFEEALKTNNFCASKPYMHPSLSCSDSKHITLTFTDNQLTKAEVM